MKAVKSTARGIASMVAATLFWSTSGLFVRSLEGAGAGEMVFWRSAGMLALVGVYLLARYRRDTGAKIKALGKGGALAALLLSFQFLFFLIAVAKTTVATALFLMSTSPFWAAIVARAFLGEAIAARTWVAMAVCSGGVAIMVWDALEFGSIAGPMAALAVSLSFAFQILCLRKLGAGVDPVPSVFVAGLFSVAMSLPFAWGSDIAARDIAILMAMGAIQLGCGCLLMTLATRELRAVDVGLIAILEIVLAPLWVWLAFAETPSGLAMLGAGIVLASLVANELFGRLRPAPGSAKQNDFHGDPKP
ncbi:MAG: DMT family transporter [Tagaea sp.]